MSGQKRILITGAAGFIGSYLCDYFSQAGYFVIGMDNLVTGDIENIAHLFANTNFDFYEQDVSNYVHVSGELDVILHFASPASPIDYLEMPIQTLKVGSLGTHNLLGLARAKGAKFMIASTSEVYGDPLEHPQTEEYWGNVNPIGPRGVYDEAKRFQESMTIAYHNVHNIDCRIARIFNTYGPRMRVKDGRALPNFMAQVLLDEPLTIYGEGQQTRSFCYIDDLIQGIVRLLDVAYNYPINLGNPDEITIRELAYKILNLNPNTASKITYLPLPKDDPQRRRPDISKARSILKWNPKVDLNEGLDKTYDYFQTKLFP